MQLVVRKLVVQEFIHFNLTDATYANKASKWDLYLYDIQTYTAIVLSQQITVTQTERVRGCK